MKPKKPKKPKEVRYNPDVPQPWVGPPQKLDKKAADKTRRIPKGFDPREGGELEGRWRPKSKQVRLALRGKLGKR